jgi:hypothetical protein
MDFHTLHSGSVYRPKTKGWADITKFRRVIPSSIYESLRHFETIVMNVGGSKRKTDSFFLGISHHHQNIKCAVSRKDAFCS